MKMPKNVSYVASFLVGVGSVLNISPVFANINDVGSLQNDSDNLKNDWKNVGNYLYQAMDKVNNERKANC